MFRLDRATEVSMALVVAAFVIGFAMVQHPGNSYVAPTMQVAQLPPVTPAAANKDEEEDEEDSPFESVFASFPEKSEQPAPAPKVQVPLNANSFDESMKRTLLLAYDSQEEGAPIQMYQPVRMRLASLPTATTPSVQKKPEISKPKAPAWEASLDDREQVARNYLKRTCPSILKFDGMQSAAERQRVQRRFMKAKTADGIIGVVRSEIRSSTIGSYWCPQVVAGM